MKSIRQKPKAKWHHKILGLEKNKEYSLDMLSIFFNASRRTIMTFFNHWEIKVYSKKKVGRAWISIYKSDEIIKRYLFIIKHGKDFNVFSQEIFIHKVRLFVKQCDLKDKHLFVDLLS